MSTPVRQVIRAAWKARLEATGYTVGVGDMPTLGPDDPGQAIVVRFVDTITNQGAKKFHATVAEIHALADADTTEAWLAIEDMVAQIKTAVETDDHKVAGLVVEPTGEEDIEREPGSETVGTVLRYAFRWQETWGHP